MAQVLCRPVEPFAVAKSPRDERVTRHLQPPLRTERVELPTAQAGARSFCGPDRLPQKGRRGREGQRRDRGDACQALAAVRVKGSAEQNPRVPGTLCSSNSPAS